MEQQIQDLQYKVEQMNQNFQHLANQLNDKLNNLDNNVFVQQGNISQMMDSMNMQIQLLNLLNQTVVGFGNKIADLEISLSNSDDAVKEMIDIQNGLSTDLHDLKNAIEGLRFIAFNQG